MQNLVIVESPTKARTLSKYLGDKYQVEASMGHIRDLPKGDIGVDVEKNFEPKYVIPRDKTKKVNELKKLAKDSKTLWLATDPDREGEAIAWHLEQLLTAYRLPTTAEDRSQKTGNIQIKRVVFHEITPEAIEEAFKNPRDLDMQLVDAQQARRILDRLVGYKLSPLLWKKVKSGLSAGRVQSVALRLIVEREKEIAAFKPEEYWSIAATLQCRPRPDRGPRNKIDLDSRVRGNDIERENFTASLIELNGKKLAIKNEKEAETHVQVLEKADYQVLKVTKKEVKKYPSPPFTTSTLQQTASNKLGLSAKKTMAIAQALYEHGLITYMRTDSFNLSAQAVDATRRFIDQVMGKDYLPASPKIYKTKSKVAQEAHEAIRPTNVSLTSDTLKTMDGMTRDHVRVYELIWKRMVASQMSEAVMDQTTVDVKAFNIQQPTANSLQQAAVSSKQEADSYLLRTTGSVIRFDGWLKLYGIQPPKASLVKDGNLEFRIKNGKEEEEEQENEKEQALPELSEGEALKLLQLLPEQHFTEAAPRFNEASLIKKLEELGIGRPSTYASILSTILERYYVEKKEKRLFATTLGMAVIDFLVKNFPNIVDYAFTAQMENELDEIAQGERVWKKVLQDFYQPFVKKLELVGENAEKVKIEAEMTDRDCPKCGKKLQVRFGRFGKFLACSGFPECKHTESIEEKIDVKCPDCEGEIVLRKTRKGRPFYGCKNWPNCKFASWTKPKP